MKIAVFEPIPRTAGVTAWAFNLAPGFRELGHHCDVVSFTKSGKPSTTRAKETGGARLGWQWWATEPDVVGRMSEAGKILDGYDLIVLNEPRCGSLDSLAKRQKKGEAPAYVQALAATRTPWLTAVHDARSYTPAKAPFMQQFIQESKNFTGVLIECRPGAYENAKWALEGRVKFIQSWPWLPYKRRGPDRSVTRLQQIALGGRAVPHKGFAALAEVADRTPDDYQVHLFGPESGGVGPCMSYRLYETLMTFHGWHGYRDGNPSKRDELHANRAINNWGSVNSGWPWWAEKDGHFITFSGGYLNAVSVWSEAAIAVHLSTDQVVTTFEYSTLESLDAGCALIAPEYYKQDMAGAPYEANWLKNYRYGTSLNERKGISWKDEHAAEELIKATWATRERIAAGEHDPSVNWKVMDMYNDPKRLAQTILEVTA